MPFDDFIDLNDDLTLTDLEKLEKQAGKAIKNAEKLKRKGAIFGASTSNTTTGSKVTVEFIGTSGLSKQDRKIEKKLERLTKKTNKDVVK